MGEMILMPSHIQKFEFIHGCVLTALMRKDKPSSLALVEKEDNSPWAMYKVNDAFLFIVPCFVPKGPQLRDGSTVWQFTFTENNLEFIKNRKSNVVLVCVQKELVTKSRMWRVLIQFDSVKKLLNLDSIEKQVSLRVKSIPNNKKLIVSGRSPDILVAASDLMNWKIPGG